MPVHLLGSYLFHLMLPQAFILQSAHPVINAAVTVDKKYLNDPWGRAKGSTELLWPFWYSLPEKAIEMGRRLRELHRSIKGTDKQMVGQTAADIRGKRKPEPYKGKGIRYENEVIHWKAGKTAVA